ncbi:hypothetical protein [Halobaculum sp. EA56]|uniref:hypothetical protein n=1 Tax=Halobaculum sp. EA56 TaxID=3421648 RepID=UPI003EBA67B9
MTDRDGRRGENARDGSGENRAGDAGDRAADGGRVADTIADVDHTAPYPEPNDVWSRGFSRASDDPRDVRR